MPTPQEIQELLDRYNSTGESGVDNSDAALSNVSQQLDDSAYKKMLGKLNAPSIQSAPILPSSSASSMEALNSSPEMAPEVPSKDLPSEYEANEASAPKLDALMEAMKRRDQLRSASMMGRAGLTIGNAIAGVKPDYSFFDEQNKLANQPVEDIKLKREHDLELLKTAEEKEKLATSKEKNDPNSEVSKLYRLTLEKMGMAVGPNATASSIEKAFPAVEKYFQAKENNATRALQREAIAGDRATKADMKLSENYRRLGETIGKMENQGRGSIGRAAEVERRADALMALATQYSNADKLTKQQVFELSNALDALIKGGQSTVSGSKELFPETYASQFQGFKQKLTNNPQGANLGAFVKQMIETAQREKEVANKYRMKETAKVVQANKHTLRPEDYEEAKNIYGDYEQLKKEAAPIQKIKVSNGKEMLMIDPKDLDHAKADGYSQVE